MPLPAPYKYKIYIPVYRNRSIESNAYLYSSNLTLMLTFKVRTHGQNIDGSVDDNNALNEFCPNGVTPTGLTAIDLNAPEDDPKDFGVWPVNRAVIGLMGNAGITIPNVRNGILLHTGEWDGWKPPMTMPNSHGCIHAWPTAIESLWHVLADDLGVGIRPNTFGKLPYPYTCQGLLSVELVG